MKNPESNSQRQRNVTVNIRQLECFCDAGTQQEPGKTSLHVCVSFKAPKYTLFIIQPIFIIYKSEFCGFLLNVTWS